MLLSVVAAILFVGCYTQLGTVRTTPEVEEYTYEETVPETESEPESDTATAPSRSYDYRGYDYDNDYDRWYPRYRYSFRYYYPSYYWPSVSFAIAYYDPWYYSAWYNDCYWYYDPWICGTPYVYYPHPYYSYYYPRYRYRYYPVVYDDRTRTNRDFGSTRGKSVRTGGRGGGGRAGYETLPGGSIDRSARTGVRDGSSVRDAGRIRTTGRTPEATERRGGERRGSREGTRQREVIQLPIRDARLDKTAPETREENRNADVRTGVSEPQSEKTVPIRRVIVRDAAPPVRHGGSSDRPEAREPQRMGSQRGRNSSPSTPSYTPPVHQSPPSATRSTENSGGSRGGSTRSGGRR